MLALPSRITVERYGAVRSAPAFATGGDSATHAPLALQCPEQQLALELHTSPSLRQVAPARHVLLLQVRVGKQSAVVAHRPPAAEGAHMPCRQEREQQSVAARQASRALLQTAAGLPPFDEQ